MPRVRKAVAAKDYPEHGISKGDTYYKWAMRTARGGVKRKSKTPPRRSQLTLSDFLSSVYDIWDVSIAEAQEPEDLRQAALDLEEQRDNCQSSLDNMPEGLQQGDTGQLLQTRIDACEEAIEAINDAADELEQAFEAADEIHADEEHVSSEEARAAARQEALNAVSIDEPDWG